MSGRKSLYIPVNKLDLFKEFEKKASDLDMSFSELFISKIPDVIKAIDNAEREEQKFTLPIKEKSKDIAIPNLKQIQFAGEKITSTPFILPTKESPFYPSVPVHLGTAFCHMYTFYKTKKKKILVYIELLHIEYNNYNPDYPLNHPNDLDFNILDQEYKYKIYDYTDFNSMILDLHDIPPSCIDDLIQAFAETEVLDI